MVVGRIGADDDRIVRLWVVLRAVLRAGTGPVSGLQSEPRLLRSGGTGTGMLAGMRAGVFAAVSVRSPQSAI